MKRMIAAFAAALFVVAGALLVSVAAQDEGKPDRPIGRVGSMGRAASQDEPGEKRTAGEAVTYKVGEAEFQGYVAAPGGDKKRAAVLIVHDWLGEKQFERDKCDALAKEGYVAFACDMFGKGVRPKNSDEAKTATGKVYSAPDTLRERVSAAFNWLKDRKDVDAAKVVAIGYCFGGKCVLDLARSGAPVAAVEIGRAHV